MTLFLLHNTPLFHSSPTHLTLTSFPKPKKSPIFFNTIKATSIPARDRVIDFGKHKGKMLGTLPSSYLKWVSNNLRARDFEHWAKLADTVLQDPVYQDRIEWEFAERLLHGDFASRNAGFGGGGDGDDIGAVSQLLEISERFGWDNEDKSAWRKVNFALLGTSKGCRIPRKMVDSDGNGGANTTKEEREKRELKRENGDRALCEGEERRREKRRERVVRSLKRQEKEEKMRILINGRKSTATTAMGNGADDDDNDGFNQKRNHDRTVEIYNPFPGRESLLKKVLNRKRLL